MGMQPRQSNAWWIEFHRDHTFAMGFHSDKPGYSGTYRAKDEKIEYQINQPLNAGHLYRPPTSFWLDSVIPLSPRITFTGYEIGNSMEYPINCLRDNQTQAK